MPENLFQKFLSGNCAPDEIRQLLQYFKDHPLEVEKYFSEEEWETFYQQNEKFIPANQSEKIFSNVEALIEKDQKKKHRLYLITGSIAASILLFIAFNFWNHSKVLDNTAQAPMVKNVLITRSNSSNENTLIALSDGTKITLYPQSEIRYDSIVDKERNVYLTGKAKFEVIHDSSRIFKVWCKDIVTTDIGTIFLIDGQQSNVRVDLYEGKVSVAKAKDANKEILLLSPGQFASYNTSTNELALGNSFKKEAPALAKTDKTKKEVTDASIIRFQNNNLKNVLDQLSAKYKVSIEYPTDKVRRVRMNMVIDTTQKIDAILKNIAVISDLRLIKESSKKYVFK